MMTKKGNGFVRAKSSTPDQIPHSTPLHSTPVSPPLFRLFLLLNPTLGMVVGFWWL